MSGEENGKAKGTDYQRTDKRPHSFRYKRGTRFVPREGAVQLARESDGTLVIGPTPDDGATQEAATLDGGQLELHVIRKRPNGKAAISFRHETLGEVVAYDARSARSKLRASKKPAG